MLMNFGNINLHNTELELTAGLPSQLFSNSLPQIALVGRSNVGKSSLINTMLGRKNLARVSGAPGKTITVNYYNIDDKLYFVDLPGYGYAKRSKAEIEKWSSLTESYFAMKCSRRIVFQLIDSKVGPTPDDVEMLEWMNYYHIPYVLVATKADKLNKTQLNKSIEKVSNCEAIRPDTEIHMFSSLKNQGREELWDTLLQKVII